METLAAAIIKSRYVIFVVFAIMAFFCSFTVGKVKTNSDLTAFLPSDSETKQGLSIMEDEFDSFSSCQVMLEGISFEDAQNLSTEISKIKNVAAVQFDDTSSHYKDRSAMFSVTFDTAGSDPGVEKAINRIEKISKPYKTYISTDSTGNYSKKLSDEMGFVIAVAVLVILAVLLFTSRSYFELIIFAAVFLSAGLMNMGTNYLLGTISSITNSVAVILQLALAIDYAIIFMHRYADESSREPDKKEALIRALSKSIVEISSSSLTTIAGLAALTMMRFRLGYDLGFVLMKGIVCSMLTVFLLMPGLVYVFAKPIEKTTHRNFVPKINFWGKLLAKKIPVFLIIFALIVPASVFLSSKADFAFSGEKVTDIISSDSRTAMHKINDTFDPDTSMVVLVPGGDY
ncbi:MAG: MMPL family transporter [Clostridia bacterium]|nr:MMPL family transporter [Clostridia bacterium]